MTQDYIVQNFKKKFFPFELLKKKKKKKSKISVFSLWGQVKPFSISFYHSAIFIS